MKKLLSNTKFQYFLVILFLTACGCSAYYFSLLNDTRVKDDSSKVVMVYMIGSDLESGYSSGTRDLKEIEQQVGDLENTKIIVYTGGSYSWHNGLPSNKNCMLYLHDKGFKKIKEEDSKSMGEPATLSEFINDVYKKYKADKYSLIMWNHGSGPLIGYGLDSKYGGDSLSLKEMQIALEQTPFKEDKKLSWIGFDACMMASAELATVLDDYADYLIASQEIEPEIGWDYSFLKDLDQYDVKTTVHSVVDKYIDTCKKHFESKKDLDGDVTLACIDLSKTKKLEESINSLFEKASSDVSGEYNDLVRERINSYGVARYSTGSDYDLVDLKELINKMKKIYPEESKRVEKELSNSVIYNKTNTKRCGGISLYYPYYNKDYYDREWRKAYKELGVLNSYQKYLSKYEQVWLGNDLLKVQGKKLVPIEEGEGKYSVKLTKDQVEKYSRGTYRILRREKGDKYKSIFRSKDVSLVEDTMRANFDGNIVYWSYHDKKRIMPLYEADLDTDEHKFFTITELEGSRNPNNKSLKDYSETLDTLMVRANFSVNRKNKKVKINGFYPASEDEALQTGKKKEVNLSDWKGIQIRGESPAHLTLDKDNNVLPFEQWKDDGSILYNILPVDDGFNFEYRPLIDNGKEYYMMFEFFDTQNKPHATQLIPISVDKLSEKGKKRKIQEQEIQWNGNSVEIYNQNGIKLEAYNKNNNIYIHGVNKTKNNIAIELSYIGVSGGYGSFHDSANLELEANSEKRELIGVSKIAQQANIRVNDIKDIYFILDINNSNYKTIEYKKHFHIRVKSMGDKINQLSFKTFLGAKASKQELYNDQEMKVTLKGLGRIENNNDDLTCILEVQNKTNKTIKYVYSGIVINGRYYPSDDSQEKEIYPHMIHYREIIHSRLKKGTRDDSYDHSLLDTLDSVASVELVLASNKELNKSEFMVGKKYAVKLDSKGKSKIKYINSKELLFNNKSIEFNYLGTYYNGNKKEWSKEWYYLINNKSKRNIMCYIDDYRTDKTLKGEKLYFDNEINFKNYVIVPGNTKLYFRTVTDYFDNNIKGIPSKQFLKTIFLDADYSTRGPNQYDKNEWKNNLKKTLLFKMPKEVEIKEYSIEKITK